MTEKELQKFDELVKAHNDKLLAETGLKLVEVDRTSKDGEKYTTTFAALDWDFFKYRGRGSSYIRMKHIFVNSDKARIALTLNLNDSQVEYIDYKKNNVLSNISNDTSVRLGCATRLCYGINSLGGLYIRVQVLLSNRIVLGDFVDPLHQDMILDSLVNGKPFNIYLERVNTVEDTSEENVELL